MKIKDIMSNNVVTIPSNTSIADASRIMIAHNITHLPVVDNNKLVGIVTTRTIESVFPNNTTSLSIWEMKYVLGKIQGKITLKDIMAKHVLTVDPDMDCEQVLALAQKYKVSSAVVLQDNYVVGIVTTTDFFKNIIDPLLGVDVPGYRVEIAGAIFTSKGPGQLEKLMTIIRKFDYKIHTIHIEGHPMKQEVHDVCFHIFDGQDINKLLEEFKNQGYTARLRNR
jgi:acetoin utilization protein AcuB